MISRRAGCLILACLFLLALAVGAGVKAYRIRGGSITPSLIRPVPPVPLPLLLNLPDGLHFL
jgi:hypothetical protein